jgi:osmoprotectant transport system permease protein
LFQKGIPKVAVAGICAGVLSFGFRFVVFKANRLARGEPLYPWDVLGGIELLCIVLPWVLLIVLTLTFSSEKFYPIACGILGNLIIVCVFFLAGGVASRSITTDQPFARLSMAAGSWGVVFAAYVLILFSIKSLSESKTWRVMVSLAGFIVIVFLLAGGALKDLSIMKEYSVRSDRFMDEFFQHLFLSSVAVFLAILLGTPLGIWAFRRSIFEKPIFFVVNSIQTIPSLAFFGILIAPLSILSQKYPFLRELGIKGVGGTPALIALTLYALLPITRNTYTSLKVLDPSVIESARGMGMSKFQLMFYVQMPLSLPIILSGIRTSMVQAVGNTTVAALIGAGGFGVFVFQGLGQAVPDLILLGAIPVILLAIAIDKIMQIVIQLITPKGITVGVEGIQ